MGADIRGGELVYNASSNRAPFIYDGTQNSFDPAPLTLLTTGQTKTVQPPIEKGSNGQNYEPVAESVEIRNKSGKTASLVLTIARDAHGKVKEDTKPLLLAVGEVIVIKARVVSIAETNNDATTQTGTGVQYIWILEPRLR